MAVMERFELAPGDLGRAGSVGRWPAADVPAAGDTRSTEASTSDPTPASVTTAATSPAAPVSTPHRATSAPFDGLMAVGAVGGSAVALIVAELAGLTGTTATVAVLVGLDVGVLVGAGAGGWLARRTARHPQAATGN